MRLTSLQLKGYLPTRPRCAAFTASILSETTGLWERSPMSQKPTPHIQVIVFQQHLTEVVATAAPMALNHRALTLAGAF
jgi:hypothetical protein